MEQLHEFPKPAFGAPKPRENEEDYRALERALKTLGYQWQTDAIRGTWSLVKPHEGWKAEWAGISSPVLPCDRDLGYGSIRHHQRQGEGAPLVPVARFRRVEDADGNTQIFGHIVGFESHEILVETYWDCAAIVGRIKEIQGHIEKLRESVTRSVKGAKQDCAKANIRCLSKVLNDLHRELTR